MLISIGGLSGSGKTTLAAAITVQLPNAVHFDSDRTRKEIFGVAETARLPPEAYSEAATQRLIDEMSRRVSACLAAGKTAVVSATFSLPATRTHQENLAQQSGVPFIGLWLQAGLSVLQERVTRRINSVSDAGVDVLLAQHASLSTPENWAILDAEKPAHEILAAALKAINPAV